MKFILLTAALIVALSGANASAEVQANRQNIVRYNTEWCQRAMNEETRAAIQDRGKTLERVCACFGEGLWKKFSNPYDWIQERGRFPAIKAAVPSELGACIDD